MNCEQSHEWIVAVVYGELPDAAAHELEQHLQGCPACRRELKELMALKVLADAYPVAEPDANLIARSRLRLEEALDELPQRGLFERLRLSLSGSFARLSSAPLAASLLFLAALAAGLLGGAHWAQSRYAEPPWARRGFPPPPGGMPPPPEAMRAMLERAPLPHGQASSDVPNALDPEEVASVSEVIRQPGGGRVVVRFNRPAPQQVEGSLDDPRIRQLLTLASTRAESSDVRDSSVDLLATECRSERGCQPAGVREALLSALRYDRSANVREKALKGLQPYVAEEMRVRDAILEALLHDPNERIRIQAIRMLEPVQADTSVRLALHSAADSDHSPQIRTVSRQFLSRTPETQ